MLERQAHEQRRRRKYQYVRLLLYVLLTLAIAILAGYAAHLNDLIAQWMGQTVTQMKAVQTSVDAKNAATDLIIQRLEEINRTLQVRQDLLTRALAESRALALLPAVDSFLDRLEADGELDFESPQEKQDISRRLKERIRPAVVNEIILRTDITDAEMKKRIERLADRYLDELLDK